MQFQDRHLKAGFTGGQSAARALLSAVSLLAPLAEASTPTSSTSEVVIDINSQEEPKSARDLGSVVVQVFVNKSGLGSALVKVCS